MNSQTFINQKGNIMLESNSNEFYEIGLGMTKDDFVESIQTIVLNENIHCLTEFIKQALREIEQFEDLKTVSEKGAYSVMKEIIEAGMNVNHICLNENQEDLTPLDFALQLNDQTLSNILKSHGALTAVDLEERCKELEQQIDYAQELNDLHREELEELLK
jgi:hypothetical protein